jgi:membrane protein DedA with SNARE-associated domain
MDCIDNDMFMTWINQYGSIALFFLLALGIVALPIPDETLIVLSGALIRNDHLHFFPTAIAAYAGGMCGITLSYLLGRSCGHFVVHKYGSWVGLNSIKLEKAHRWFEHYGKWTLLFGYFIPGFRHFSGLLAGSVALNYKEFALFAYVGAFIWASFFLSIGYFLGSYCFELFNHLEITFDKLLIAVAILLVIIACVRVVWTRYRS